VPVPQWGSKNLKAVAIKGTRTVNLHHPIDFQKAVATANHQIASSAQCRALTDSGTSFAVNLSSEVGALPYKNFLSQHDKKAAGLILGNSPPAPINAPFLPYGIDCESGGNTGLQKPCNIGLFN
jgi:hypothetical protein